MKASAFGSAWSLRSMGETGIGGACKRIDRF
jgi:hypothetical protein